MHTWNEHSTTNRLRQLKQSTLILSQILSILLLISHNWRYRNILCKLGPCILSPVFRSSYLVCVCDEAAQINFTFHEGETIGQDAGQSHGPNAVISMLDHYLENYCQERVLAMHAENCVGQNKNCSVIADLAWRVLVDLSDELSLSFMRVGHTRCSIDEYFGLLKKSFRSNEVDSMVDCVKMIDNSYSANEAPRFSWSWREWDAFLTRFFGPTEALLRRGRGYPPFAEGRYFCCGSCWSREATSSPANGHLYWPLALLEQEDQAISSFWFPNFMGEWRITCFIFGHTPLSISISLW